MTTVTISLPESLKKFLDEQIKTQGFGNVSEYFRTLLRDAQNKYEQKKLETLLLEGLANETETEVSSGFWNQLKKEAASIVARQRKD